MSISLDLPRDELIGWIGKQISLGVRSTASPPVSDKSSVMVKISEIADTKKEIVTISKAISEKINYLISEKWRSVELEHTLLKAQTRRDKLLFQLAAVEGGKFTSESVGTRNPATVVSIRAPGFESVVEAAEARTTTLLTHAEAVWKECYREYFDDVKNREQQEKLISASFAGDSSDASIASRRAAVLEDYLHERYLLKQQKERRSELEAKLRNKIAALSAELHSIRDLSRIKAVVDESKHSEFNQEMEMGERMLEWQLMEDEIRLERQVRDVDVKYESKIARLKRDISRVTEVFKVENEFISEKDEAMQIFKNEISLLRGDMRAIEQAISQFRSFLRHDEKVKRQNAQGLRE